MKKLALLIVVLALASIPASAKSIIDSSLPVNGLNITCGSAGFSVDMNLLTGEFKPSRNSEYVITPVLISEEGTDSVEFSSVIVAGRNLYYSHLREHNAGSTPVYYAGKQQEVAYSDKVPFQPWMYNAGLKIRSEQRGCCQTFVTEYSDNLARTSRVEYIPQFNYVQPVAEPVKEYDISGSAFVNFRLNKTALDIDYMTNRQELSRITGTIDSIKGDADITITSIFIKGFASPEGSYSNNERLAKGRTETLKTYVENLYRFPKGFITSDYTAEDWEGLKTYVEKSEIANRNAILEIIDSPLEPDAKNSAIQQRFPTEYAFLLENVYPTLRHSDYVICYTVRSYTSLDDILRVFHSAPQKLSKEEFYRAAQSMEQGSTEYNEVFETAVRMFPDDEVCNLNAANSAMQSGNLQAAARYLEKAGDDASAIYARGVLAALQKNYSEAETYFAQAARLKVADAPSALEMVKKMKEVPESGIQIIME